MIAEKSKLSKLDFLLLPLIIILVAVTAFGLGRLSALEEQKGEIEITYDQTS